MGKSIIAEGKTTNEAIDNGLKKLNVSKNQVEIKVLEAEEKRSFFSILAPRIVKVELIVKEDENEKNIHTQGKKNKKEIILTTKEQEKAVANIENFLKDFVKNMSGEVKYNIKAGVSNINVEILGEAVNCFIGYRGETLYALQNILTAIAGKGIENRVKVILDIEGYKSKREKTLEDLAEKVAKTVIRTKKSVKLEPMKAYERKIIHSKLQDNPKIETISVGEEPHRRIIISLKK